MTAGCIDTDLPLSRRNVGLPDGPLIETTHVHHAMWVMSTEIRCQILVTDLRRDLSEAAQDNNLLRSAAILSGRRWG